MTFQICVQQRKKLFLYEFFGNRFEFISELNLPEPALTALWVGKMIFLAYKSEYMVLETMDNSINPFIGTSESSSLMRPLTSGEILFKQDKKGVLLEGASSPKHGLSVQGSALSWHSSPLDLVNHYPYVLSLQPESSSIEVHSTFSWKIFQKINISPSIVGLKQFVPRNTVLVQNEELFVLVHSDKAVYALVAPPYPIQAQNLVNSGNIEEGIFLLKQTCDQLREYHALLMQLQVTAAWSRFKSCEWKRAMVHFSSAQTPPSEIVPSFPHLMLDLTMKQQDDEKLVRTIIRKQMRLTSEADIEKHVKEASIYLTEYLEEIYKKHSYDNTYQLQMIAAIFISKVKYGPSGSATSPNLWQFLCMLSDQDISAFTPSLEKWSTKESYFTTLGLIYRLKKLNRKALEEWSAVIAGKTSKDVLLDPVAEIISLLQSTNDIELLEQFSPIVLKAQEPIGGVSKFLSIFASPYRTSLIPLPWMMSFCASYDKSIIEQYLEYLVFDMALKDEKVETALAFHYLGSIPALELTPPSKTDYHPSGTPSSSSNSLFSSKQPSASPQSLELSQQRRKLLTLLEQQSSYNAAAVLMRVETLPLYFEKVALYEKMGDHEKALNSIVFDLSDFDRAETYCIKHESNNAESLLASLLKIYLDLDSKINKLSHPNSSTEHDNSSSSSNTSDSSTMESNSVDIGEGGGNDQRMSDGKPAPAKALDLLNRYPTKIRPATVLSLLPPQIPIQYIFSFLIQSMRSNTALLRHQSVVLGLERSMNLQVTSVRYNMTQRSVLVTEDTTCPICMKKIEPNMFARYPNNVLVHFGCMKNKHIDPVTGRNFYSHPSD